MKFNQKRKKGFTLIELIIVVAIIAILAAIAIPKYNVSKQTAKDAAHESNVSMLTSAAVLRQQDLDDGETITWKADEDDHKKYIEKWPASVDGENYQVTITKDNISVEKITPAE